VRFGGCPRERERESSGGARGTGKAAAEHRIQMTEVLPTLLAWFLLVLILVRTLSREGETVSLFVLQSLRINSGITLVICLAVTLIKIDRNCNKYLIRAALRED
jgi:hypothetical protein